VSLRRQLGIALSGSAVALGCAPPTRYEQPSALRGYEILITRRDSLGQGIAEGLRRRGLYRAAACAGREQAHRVPAGIHVP